MSTKKPENTIQEADASLGMHEREYIQESLSYVLRIQEVQERIKFEFVEILLAFISGWLVFYHTAHEQAEDHRDYLQDLRHKVQKTRENFEEAREKVTELKTKYMEKRTKPEEIFTKRGYLFLMEKKPFKATWTKYYCTFKKQKREFTMLQFNQMNHNFTRPEARDDEKLTLFSCQRRASEFEKRFCFDLTFKEKPGVVYTFQALSEKDHRYWISAMDGTEPTYLAPGKIKVSEAYHLDEAGFMFIRRCIQVLEIRGLEDEGIYRKSGVGTKISKLLALGLNQKESDDVFVDDKYRDLMESNTIASALKMYLRNLNEPLMTYQYHSDFIEAAKQETLNQRVNEVHKLVYKLPQPNFQMLDMVICHLTDVSRKYEKNKMSVFNLGVVFGPTLLRPREESVAAILDIKFNNIVINILIDNYERIFKNKPSADIKLPDATKAPSIMYPSRSSPPTRMPRASQIGKAASTGAMGSSSNTAGNPMFLNQQKIYRVVSKTNCTEPTMSSSLQNIPNGDNYALGSNAMNSSGGAQCISLSPPMHMLNGILSPTIGSINNLHTISKNETSTRRYVPDTEIAPDYGIIGANNGGVTLQSHHAVPVSSTSNFRHPEYLMTTANPVTQSGSSSHIYTNTSSAGANSSNRISLSNVSPPNTAMRKERFLGSASGPQQHPPVQRGLHSYGQTKHYSPLMPTSTSSSNDSVCDSLSSNNGLGSSIVANSGNSGNVAQHLSARNTNDYALISSQNSSLSPHLGPTCDEVVTATTLPSVSLSCGGTASESTEYPPSKMHRNRDVNQIKRDLSTGTARVRTLYACMGESEGELSFEPNQIITNVRYSHEPGWLQGTLNGKTGLIPENYVEHLKPHH
nr:LD28528p [Drosophila melanogaster]